MANYDIVTKANLQYYDGKLKRALAKKGETRGFRYHGKDFQPYYQGSLYSGDKVDILRIGNPINETTVGDMNFSVVNNYYHDESGTSSKRELHITSRNNGENTDVTHVQFGDYFYLPEMNEYTMMRESDVYTKDYVDNLLQTSAGHKFVVVSSAAEQFTNMLSAFLDFTSTPWDSFSPGYLKYDELRTDTVYAFPMKDVSDGEQGDYFNEYIYIPGSDKETSKFEFIGTTKQDLTGYVKEENIKGVDNDYIDGLFFRDLEPGAYASDGMTLRVPWDDLVNGGGKLGLSYPILFLNNEKDTVIGVYSIGWGDAVSESGPILVVPSTITAVSANPSNFPNTSSNNPGFQNISDLQMIYFKNPNVNLLAGLGSNMGNLNLPEYNPFRNCPALTRIYFRGSLPTAASEKWFVSGGAPFARIINV